MVNAYRGECVQGLLIMIRKEWGLIGGMGMIRGGDKLDMTR